MEWTLSAVLAVMVGLLIWSNIFTAPALDRSMQSSVDYFFGTLAAAISTGHAQHATQRAFEEIAELFRRAMEGVTHLFRWQ